MDKMLYKETNNLYYIQMNLNEYNLLNITNVINKTISIFSLNELIKAKISISIMVITVLY